MILFLIAVLGVFFIGSRRTLRGSFDNPWSKDAIQALKGVFILLVFVSHFVQYVKLNGALDVPYLAFRRYFGQLVVVPFLFFSGYGVVASVASKGRDYVRAMPVNRMTRIAFEFSVAVIVYLLVLLAFGIVVPFRQAALAFLAWTSVGNSNWYIMVIVLLYLLTYLSYRTVEVVAAPRRLVAMMAVLTGLAVVFIPFLCKCRPAYCCNTAFAYVAGGWFYLVHDRIRRVLSDNFFAWVLTMVFLASSFALIGEWRSLVFAHQAWSVIFALFVALLLMKVSCRNRLLVYCGTHLFSLYIFQRLPMHILRKTAIAGRPWLYLSVSLVLAFALSAAFDWLMPKWWRRVQMVLSGGLPMRTQGPLEPAKSRKIAVCGFVCAIMVVFIHAGCPQAPGSDGWWFWAVFTAGICRISVPFFFVVSGYFIGRRLAEPGWWSAAVYKRFRTLFCPYIVFAVCFAVYLLVLAFALKATGGVYASSHLTFSGGRLIRVFGLDLTRWPELVPLWYVRSLILYFLLLPFFLLRGKWTSLALPSVLFGLAVVLQSGYLKWGPAVRCFTSGLSVWGMAFFLAGTWLARFADGRWTRKGLGGLCLLIGAGLVAATILAMLAKWPYATGIRYASVPFLLYGFWSLMPELKLPAWLEGVSFPIFVLHPFFVRLFNVVTGLVNDASVPVVLARVAIALAASILVTRLLKRFAPAAGEFLFGGR